jgi:membrane-associated phospholipid phosphatase
VRWRILLFLLRRVEPTFIRVREKLLLWAQRRDTWLRRQFLALLDPNRNEILSLLVLGLLLIGATWTFLAILEDVVSQDDLVGLDRAVYAFLRGLRTAWADRLMIVITELGDSVVTTAVAAAAILWLAWHRAWRAAAHLAAAVLFASLFNTIIKVTLHVGRPTNLYTGWTAYSFPSGHATINVALYGFLCFLIARECRPRLRSIVIGGVAIFVSMIAFSRIYLGAHWFSDVVAGVAFGLMWISLLGLVYLWHNPPPIGAERLLALVCSVLIVVGGFHVARSYNFDWERHAVHRDLRLPWPSNPSLYRYEARQIDDRAGREAPEAGSLDSLHPPHLLDAFRSPPLREILGTGADVDGCASVYLSIRGVEQFFATVGRTSHGYDWRRRSPNIGVFCSL